MMVNRCVSIYPVIANAEMEFTSASMSLNVRNIIKMFDILNGMIII